MPHLQELGTFLLMGNSKKRVPVDFFFEQEAAISSISIIVSHRFFMSHTQTNTETDLSATIYKGTVLPLLTSSTRTGIG